MPRNALVTLRFGPYRSCGVLEYKAFRLQGLQAVLEMDGHQLILEEIPDWNNVELIVNGETVFQCNINDLDFGGDGKLDPLCEAARIAVLNAC
uniref:Chromosome 10 open reading frame 53 n=1 Tax=Sphenodon punctatus TaxID=8508 RepID=A0A8D0GD67_SPHPU